MVVRRSLFTILTAALVVASAVPEAKANPPFVAFESGQVRPLALSPNGKLLFAVNTPDNRLEIYRVTNWGLVHLSSVAVGLEPVAVAARSNKEVWVVNHASDSVSVVSLVGPPRVTDTLLVGDEPRDIVFAGPSGDRAFITAAHRGQNAPFEPELETPGLGRADVWVFDANNLGAGPGGTPLTIVNLFSDTPRALAVDASGEHVYAAAFNSGNQTTVVSNTSVPDDIEANGGPPGPNVNYAGDPEPSVGIIVKDDGEHWRDAKGNIWDHLVRFDLPDEDVFVIDASAPVPEQVAGDEGVFAHVGTTLFNMIVNPVSGKVYVTNTEARNIVRFEGEGVFGGSTVRGHSVDNRITVLDENGVHPRLLNKHIDYDDCCGPKPAVNELSVSQPLGMAITDDGAVLYSAVLGNDKVAVYYTAELEDDVHYPDIGDQIPVSGGGPTGVVLDESRDRLYVLTRFDNGISIIDTDSQAEIDHLTMHNPEPADLIAGRRFLYDAALTSSNGDQSCASCHIFGDKDELAWDLGDPDGDIMATPSNIRANTSVGDEDFHPMKGPMTTQSLRGLDNHGPMHWRGDRNGEALGPPAQPNDGAFSEVAAFNTFNVAFPGLVGLDQELSAQDMQAFTDFALQMMYPPNPIRALDNSLTAQEQEGADFFFNNLSFINVFGPNASGGFLFTCNDCHVIDPEANAEYGIERPGFFGTDGQIILAEFSQTFKTPHFRNLYTKVGMFGHPEEFLFNAPFLPSYTPDHQGDQIRGFGFTHDGTRDTISRFHNVFFDGFTPEGFASLEEQQAVSAFLLASDTNFKPITGQQLTLDGDNGAEVGDRLDLLHARAALGDCDLIAKARFFFFELGLLYDGTSYTSSFSGVPNLSRAQVEAFADSTPVTFTCVPPGSGYRLGVDRDGDGFRDGDERFAASDPADPFDTP